MALLGWAAGVLSSDRGAPWEIQEEWSPFAVLLPASSGAVFRLYYQPMADDPIQWLGDRLRILDQTKLPKEEVFIDLRDHRDVVEAIRELKVRGAPAIGVAAAYAVALEAGRIEAPDRGAYVARLTDVARALAASRPTAVNLFNALNRMTEAAKGDTVERIRESLVEEARRIHLDELQASERLSRLGAELIGDGCSVLTHCNAGRLATAGYGTALGVIRAAREQGKKVSVFATETRPLLQGTTSRMRH